MIVNYGKRYSLREYPWSGDYVAYENIDPSDYEPLVYYFTGHNGEYAEYLLKPITSTTTADIFTWIFDYKEAKRIVESLNSTTALIKQNNSMLSELEENLDKVSYKLMEAEDLVSYLQHENEELRKQANNKSIGN